MWSPNTLFIICFTALMVCHPASTVEECPGKGSCPAQTNGTSMLQIGKQMSKVTRESVNQTIFGVPILMETSTEDETEESDWVVVLKDDNNIEATVHRACQTTPKCTSEELALGMITLHCTWQELEEFVTKNRDEIESIENDGVMVGDPDFPGEADPSLLQAGNVNSWGLDRIDARSGLDNSYTPPAGAGQGVHVYVLDTGIRTTHNDFGGRAIPTLEILGNGVKECKGSTGCARDGHGHGTHCAGTVGGSKFGVAKKATLHAVKVLTDNNGGQWSWFASALDWIVRNGEEPAVVSASIKGRGTFQFLKTAVEGAVNHGITVVVCAGNENDNGCKISPGYIPAAISVGATNSNDGRASFSNYGTCVDIFAPGVNINSAGHRSNGDTEMMSGTSMACPHVSGVAALLLQDEPNLSPQAVAKRLISDATKDKVKDAKGTPNRMLYVEGGPTPPQTTAPPPAGCEDQHWKCPNQWKNKCHKAKFQKLCPLTCGQCTSTTGEECKNKHPKCLTKWKNKCHKASVQNKCPLMCGKCTV